MGISYGYRTTLEPLDIGKLMKNRTGRGGNKERARRKLRILERDKFSCVICKSNTFLTIDHKTPKRKFHSNGTKNNLYLPLDECQTLCVTCHEFKNYLNLMERQGL